MALLVATIAPIKLEPMIDPQNARTLAIEFGPNLTIARGTLIGQITASGKGAVYAAANVDGSQVPVGPAVYDFTTDANGYVVLGTTGSVPDLTRPVEKTAEVYWKGTFLSSEVVGSDANAISVMQAREIGVGSRKMLHIP